MWSRKQTPAESKMASRDDMSKHDGSALCVATAVAPSEISWEKRSWQICGRFTSVKVCSKCFGEKNAQPKKCSVNVWEPNDVDMFFWGRRELNDARNFAHWVIGSFSSITRWWFQNILYFYPYLGKIPILTSIFFKGVGSTTNHVIVFDLSIQGVGVGFVWTINREEHCMASKFATSSRCQNNVNAIIVSGSPTRW